MDWRKAALWTAAAVALVVAAAAFALQALVDPDRLRKAARDRALAAWERELLMADVSLDLLPLPSLRASKVSLANPGWAKDPHLLQADVVRADLELLPLLVGKVRIKRLALDGVRAGLEVGDDGALSWELKEAQPAKKVDAPPGEEEEVLQVAAIHIRNARIALRSRREDLEPWRIEEAVLEALPGQKDVRLEGRLVRYGQAVQVKAEFADLSALGRQGAATAGRLELAWPQARLSAAGRFALHRELAGQDLEVRLQGDSIHELFAFFGISRRRTAAVDVRFKAREREGRMAIEDLAASLGALQARGEATVTLNGKPRVEARLQADRVDWLKVLVDAGGEVKPPRKNEQVFHPDPVAWRAVTTLGELEGGARIDVKSLRMGNGIETRNVRARFSFGDGRIEIKPLALELLGGSMQGAMQFDGRRKTIGVDLAGRDLALERWFHERGSKVPFEGGPMQVQAKLTLAGATYRDLAASTSGTLAIRMGKGSWKSKRAGEAEETMVRVLAPKDGTDVDFECAVAALQFRSGRASGRSLLGARSDVSQLLTSGYVDLREETLDLRGRLVPRSGPRIGLASLAGEVQITGRLAKPTMQLDPDAKPAVVARAGAALATAGVTLLGSALIDAAEAKNNPCEKAGG